MKSWIWGIIMLVGNAALWGMMFLLLFIEPSTFAYVNFSLMSILVLVYAFGAIVDIRSYVDDKVEDEKNGKDKN
jgi:hypothetical protein